MSGGFHNVRCYQYLAIPQELRYTKGEDDEWRNSAGELLPAKQVPQ